MRIVYIVIFFVFISNFGMSQVIPFGTSADTIVFIHDTAIPSARNTWFIAYNKPANYDPATSDIVIYFHGQGGSEREGIFLTQTMCNRRGALFVGLNDRWGAWTYPWDYYSINYGEEEWMVTFPPMMEQLYKYILQREGRDSANVRILGFSAGGQLVTRYMLIRQGVPDNIPIKMGISINPYYYTFPTKEYNGIDFTWQSLCGLKHDDFDWYAAYGIISHEYYGIQCEEHIKGYYNENYTVMIGALDIEPVPGGDCIDAQGSTRLERAQNFYSFCLQDAIERGTSLQWNYVEVPNIGHDGYGMINTLMPDGNISYCEHYLFDMPYHEPQKFKPTADFNYTINDSTKCYEFNAESECWWQTVPTSFRWDFGNGIIDTNRNVIYNYTENGNYNVKLTISNIYGADSISKYIEVTNMQDAAFEAFDTVATLPYARVNFAMYLTLPNDSVFWNFGDGHTSNYLQPIHYYDSAGIFTVTLIKSKFACADTVSKTVRVVNMYNGNSNIETIDNKDIMVICNENTIVVSSENSMIQSIKIVNSNGQLLYSKSFLNAVNEHYIPSHNLHGLYFCVIETEDKEYVKPIVIIN